MINPLVTTLIKGMLYLILKAKQGGKYLDRKKVVDRKTGKMRYKYKYKPMQQRAAHEVTRNKFEKVTKLSGDEHKNQIEHALQNGIHVSLHVLRDYPDLAVKYHQQARLAKADKIRAKVKASKEKERIEREVRLNTPEGLKNNPIKLEAERMMREDGLIKDVKVADSKNMNVPITENRFKKLDFGGSSNTYSKTTTPETKYNAGVSIQNYKTGITLNFNYDKFRNKVTIGLHDSNKPPRNATTEIETVTSLNQKRVDELLNKYIKTAPDNREVKNNFDTMPESEIKNVIKDKLIKLGGKEFIKDNTHRVYFNEGFLRRAFGLYTKKHPNGIDSIYFENGKETDVNNYNLINQSLRSGKVNFDLNKGVFHINMRGKGNFDGLRLASGQAEDIVNYINKETGLNIPYEALWKNEIPLKESLPKDQPNNFDTMPESKPEPAKNPDLKANFESWKEERKTAAAPAFKLEQEDITSKEKNTRFNDAQGGLFGKKPVTHESYAKKDLKPALKLEGNETITSLVTAVKSALMSEGLDTRAREFVDKAFKEKDLASVKKLASEYVDMKESSQVPKPAADDKGREEKKMSELKGKDMPLRGNEKIHERFYEDAKGYFVDYATNGFRPRILVGVGTKENEIARDSNGEFEIREPKGFEIKDLKERGVDPNNYIMVNGSPVRKEAKAGIESAIKRFEEIALEDPYERKQKERKRLESLGFPSGKIEEIENSLEDEQRGFNKFMESEEDYSKMKPSKYTIADLEAEYAKYPKFVTHRKLKDRAYRLTDPDELDAIYAKMAELEKS